MEAKTAKPKSKKPTAEERKQKLIEAYIAYVLENGKAPASIFQFMKSLKMKETSFYHFFNSFEVLQQHIWDGFFERTLARIQGEEVYAEYGAREKMLAFYYTWLEELLQQRSYVLLAVKQVQKPTLTPIFLRSFREKYLQFVEGILAEAKANEEVVDRPLIGSKYGEGLWLQVLFVLHFWVKDDSIDFEKTDAAVEKAVHLSFDLMGRGPLDAMVDFARFLYQNR